MSSAQTQTAVRPALRDDLPILGQIWCELMEKHFSVDHSFALAEDALERWYALAEEMVDREDGFLFVAELGGRTVGFCLGWIAQNPPIYERRHLGFISEIVVARAERRRGVGRALIEAARRWFTDSGLEEFQLSTATWNEEAKGFWKAVGGQPHLVRYRFEIVRPQQV